MHDNQRAAHRFAETGIHVFPCIPGEKVPAVAHGFEEATTDHRRIQAWWQRNPERNVAVRTGAPYGPDVLDVDVHEGGSGFAAFSQLKREGLIGQPRAIIQTPSGGMHAWYAGTEQRNGHMAKAHLDFRSNGGYVVAPPSQVNGKPYVVVSHQATPDTFDWGKARELLDPQPKLPKREPDDKTTDIDRLAKWIESQPDHHNDALFWAANRAIEAGRAAELDRLKEAAMRTGHDERIAARTIASALRTSGFAEHAETAAMRAANQPMKEQDRPLAEVVTERLENAGVKADDPEITHLAARNDMQHARAFPVVEPDSLPAPELTPDDREATP